MTTRDPVCGKEVDALRARAVGIWGGRTYYFCSPEHKAEFAGNPAAYGELGAREPTARAVPLSSAKAPTPALGRAATPAAGRATTPAAGKPVAVREGGSSGAREIDPTLPAPPPALRGGQPEALVAASDDRHEGALDAEGVDEHAVPVRGAAWKLVLVCALALGAGLIVFLLKH